ncbi:WD repeat-containing protein 74 [Cimex lectularius]|uniref:WD repeat-containing protein 74 n=1 Tax=Cimex lectularius TaxID=79782 RepID=A0A8I6SAC5_CIMLE|nr:WD repeat-containing protein 74 [Cimex lectularius]
MKNQNFNCYVGTASGIFKGVHIVEKHDLFVKNIDGLKSGTNKNPITCMNWAEPGEEEVIIGYSNQLVKVYNVKSRSFTSQEEKKCGQGSLIGVAKFSDAIMTGVDGGSVKIWRPGGETTTIECGNNLERIRHSLTNEQCFASGGKENDLKIWDINTGATTFTAKNVRHDELELRVPVWVTDIVFLTNSQKVAVTTRYGHVRLYDPSTPTRRPVMSVQVPEQALISMSTCCKDQHVIVGSGTGQMNLVDLRSKGLVMNKYKGSIGGIKSIACSLEEPYIASVSLDRHFRLHHLNTKELLFKEYMQSKLSCVLVSPNLDINKCDAASSEEEELLEKENQESPPYPESDEGIGEKVKEEELLPPPVAEKRTRTGGASSKKKQKPS